MSTQEQRKRFEVWFIAEQYAGRLYSSDEDGSWSAWQAAEAAAIEWCAKVAELEPRVWDADAQDPQKRIALKIRALLPKEES